MSAQTLPALDSTPPEESMAASSEDTAAGGGQITVHLAEDGIVEVTLPANSAVRSSEAQAAAAAVRMFADGRRVPVLLRVTGVLSVTDKARVTYTNAAAISACALLGESPVDRVIAHFLLRAKPPSIPGQFFTSDAEARNWLKEHQRES